MVAALLLYSYNFMSLFKQGHPNIVWVILLGVLLGYIGSSWLQNTLWGWPFAVIGFLLWLYAFKMMWDVDAYVNIQIEIAGFLLCAVGNYFRLKYD